MNPFKRMVATLHGSFEALLDDVENHEAVAAAAIREVGRAAERARAQYTRVRLDGEKLDRRAEELRAERTRWTERARRAHEKDEAMAIECVRRVKAAETQIAQVERQRVENESLQTQLGLDLQRIEERVKALSLKRNQLACREASAQALKALGDLDSGSLVELDALFDRWEGRIAGYEGSVSAGARPGDTLERKFSREEEDVELKARLAEILKTE